MASLNEKIIDDFEKLQKQAVELIEMYGIEITRLSKAISIDRQKLYRRMSNKDFTPEELRRLVRFINDPSAFKQAGS